MNKISKKLMHIVGLIALFSPMGQAAQAEDLENMLETRLLSGWRQAGGTHMAAISIALAPGWHTYWRAPGDAGIPPRFDWSASENVQSAHVIWPRPEVIEQNGYRSIGYHDTLVLPLVFTPDRAGRDMQLTGTIEIGVCKDICIPKTLRVNAVLPASGGAPDPRIAAALADRPYTGKDVGARDISCTIAPAADGITVNAQFTLPGMNASDAVVIETGDRLLWVSQPEVAVQGNAVTAQSDVAHVEGAPFALKRSDIRISVLGTSRAVEITGCPRRK